MTTQKRVSISLTLSPDAYEQLLTQARAGAHRYPSVYASTLLERALSGGGPQVLTPEELKEALFWLDEILLPSSEETNIAEMGERLRTLLKRLAGVG